MICPDQNLVCATLPLGFLRKSQDYNFCDFISNLLPICRIFLRWEWLSPIHLPVLFIQLFTNFLFTLLLTNFQFIQLLKNFLFIQPLNSSVRLRYLSVMAVSKLDGSNKRSSYQLIAQFQPVDCLVPTS